MRQTIDYAVAKTIPIECFEGIISLAANSEKIMKCMLNFHSIFTRYAFRRCVV